MNETTKSFLLGFISGLLLGISLVNFFYLEAEG